ncbi:MAG: OmpH family outer membrane protein [Polyangiales bacterium]
MRFPKPLRAATFVVAAFGAVVLAPYFSEAASAAEVSIVYVDFDKIVAEVDEGQNASELMKKEQAKRQGDIQAMEAKIKKLQDDLEKQSKAFSKDALEKKAAEYQQALAEYQQIVMKFNNELSAKEREFFEPIERKVKDMLRTIAMRDGYDMILNKRSVPYGRKDLDLTDKIIQEFNKQYPSKKPAATTSATAKKPPVAPTTSASVAPKMK